MQRVCVWALGERRDLNLSSWGKRGRQRVPFLQTSSHGSRTYHIIEFEKLHLRKSRPNNKRCIEDGDSDKADDPNEASYSGEYGTAVGRGFAVRRQKHSKGWRASLGVGQDEEAEREVIQHGMPAMTATMVRTEDPARGPVNGDDHFGRDAGAGPQEQFEDVIESSAHPVVPMKGEGHVQHLPPPRGGISFEKFQYSRPEQVARDHSSSSSLVAYARNFDADVDFVPLATDAGATIEDSSNKDRDLPFENFGEVGRRLQRISRSTRGILDVDHPYEELLGDDPFAPFLATCHRQGGVQRDLANRLIVLRLIARRSGNMANEQAGIFQKSSQTHLFACFNKMRELALKWRVRAGPGVGRLAELAEVVVGVAGLVYRNNRNTFKPQDVSEDPWINSLSQTAQTADGINCLAMAQCLAMGWPLFRKLTRSDFKEISSIMSPITGAVATWRSKLHLCA